MKNVLLLLAKGFDLSEAGVFIDVIGWAVPETEPSTRLYTCGLAGQVQSSCGHWLSVGCTVGEIYYDRFDALAIPGGSVDNGFYGEAHSEKFLDVIRTFRKQGKVIAPISSGTLPTVEDSSTITSRDPSAAMDVAFLLLERLTSRVHADRIRESMGLHD